MADQQNKISSYKAAISKACSVNDIATVKDVVGEVLVEDTPVAISKGVLLHLASCLAKMSGHETERRELIEFILKKLPSGIVSFEEPDALLREHLSSIYMDEEDYVEAARVLAAINLESGSRLYSDAEKAEKYVQIAELYLQEDDSVSAETFINRASRVMHAVGTSASENIPSSMSDESSTAASSPSSASTSAWALQLRYKVCYARILDARRKFLDAALRYYDLSQSDPSLVDLADLQQLLSKAATCSILASAGAQRSRLLGTLFKDERSRSLPPHHFCVLEKMYRERLLSRDEVQAFETTLLPHQRAQLPSGFSVLEQAVLEHNMLAAAKIYRTVKLSDLGTLLDIDAGKAERVAAKMITENRLTASIDQIQSVLVFHNAGVGVGAAGAGGRTEAGNSDGRNGAREAAGDDVLQEWDGKLRALCGELSRSYDNIRKFYPDLCGKI